MPTIASESLSDAARDAIDVTLSKVWVMEVSSSPVWVVALSAEPLDSRGA